MAHLGTLPVLLVPAPVFSSPLNALVVAATTVVDTNPDELGVHTSRMRQLELQPREMVLEEVSRVVDGEELDEPDPVASLIASQPHSLYVVDVKDLQVWRDAGEPVEYIILRRVARDSFNDDSSRRSAGSVSAGRAGA